MSYSITSLAVTLSIKVHDLPCGYRGEKSLPLSEGLGSLEEAE